MLIKDEKTRKFLRNLPLFDGLAENDVLACFRHATITHYPKGHPICALGEPAAHLFLVIEGWVKLYRTTMTGAEAIFSILPRGGIFGESAVINGTAYPFSAEAAEDAIILALPAAVLQERARHNPDIITRIVMLMSREILKQHIQNEHLAIMNAPQRVGCLLLQLSADMIGKGCTFPFPYDKSLAATYLGMKAETFSRALVQLAPYGVIVLGPEIKIENFQRLIAYVCDRCSSQSGECAGSRDFEYPSCRRCADQKASCH